VWCARERGAEGTSGWLPTRLCHSYAVVQRDAIAFVEAIGRQRVSRPQECQMVTNVTKRDMVKVCMKNIAK